MTCRYRITTPAGSTVVESPMDFWECHAVILDHMGIKDVGPIVDSKHAAEHARNVLAGIARRGAVNGTNTAKTSRRK